MVGTANGNGNDSKTPITPRQAFSIVNGGQDPGMRSGPGSIAGSDCGGIEFTREEVDALLNMKIRTKDKFNLKEKCEIMMDYIKKLRLCVRWFQEFEGELSSEHEKLKKLFESAERKSNEMEMLMNAKEEELNSIIAELQMNYAALQEKFTKEETEKLAAIETLMTEKNARMTAERAQASLTEDLEKAQREGSSANLKIVSLNDMYKRLQEYNTSLQQYNSKLQTELNQTSETLNKVEREKASLMENLSNLRGYHESQQDQLASTKASLEETVKLKDSLASEVGCLRGDLHLVREDRDRQLSLVQDLTAEVLQYKECTGKSAAELGNLTSRAIELEATCALQTDTIKRLQDQLATAEKKLEISDLSSIETRTGYEEQKKLNAELQIRLAEAESKVIDGEALRKKLHNTIQELKGNIRVFCRVRPLMLDEGVENETKTITFPTTTEALGRGIEVLQHGQAHPFMFDKVFTPQSSQEEVFTEISQLVQSALDGYKVCIFAYGQTGSGKTHTMMGTPGSYDDKGLIPRSLEQIFEARQKLKEQGWKYEMQVSMLEIYNETIRDLLSSNKSCSTDGGNKQQYAIKHDPDGNTHVSDLTILDVRSSKEVSFLLNRAAQSRSVGKTQMNEQSSRSHFVFTLRISGVNEVRVISAKAGNFDPFSHERVDSGYVIISKESKQTMEQNVHGVLNLIDLAGSERLSKSGSTGDRLKETQAINKSLSSLSDVIFALAKKEEHIPFRNSKLTYLLQPCLGGDSKTLMVVNVSPAPTSINESLCSLRFAARVNSCEISIPRRQTSMRHMEPRLSYG